MPKDTKFKVTPVQTQVLCTFFEEHPEVVRGYKKTPECIEAVQIKWKNVTQKLNTIGPARDHRAWAKYLCDMKAKLKRKHIKWRQNSSGTGPVMCNADDFNEINLRMLQVLRKYPAESQVIHDSNQSDMAIDKTKTEDINNDNIGPQEFTNTSNDSIDLIHNSPVDHVSEFVNEMEYDDFDTLGRYIAKKLQTMPLSVAMETQEMLLSILRKQHLRLQNEGCSTIDPLDKL